MDRKPDVTYSVVFRRYKDNQVIGEQRERGRWAFSNGMYTTLTQFIGDEPTDPKDKHFHDIYFVESFDGDEMTYKHVETGLMFKSKRVSDGFQLNISPVSTRSEEHTSELQSLTNLVCRLLLEKKK